MEKKEQLQQTHQYDNQAIAELLISNPVILPYLFWDNAISIHNSQNNQGPHSICYQEKDYFSALSNALLHALLDKERFAKEISIAEIETLHKECAVRTGGLNKSTVPGVMFGHGQHYEYGQPFTHSFLNSIVEDAQLLDNMHLIEDFSYAIAYKPGLKDLISNKKNVRETLLDKNDAGALDTIIFCNGLKTEEIHQIVNILIQKYSNSMAHAASDQEKIKAMVEMIRPLQRLHPFVDANGRTMFMLLLNRELVKHNMLPTIPDNPNDIDICSTDEAVQGIQAGQARFKAVVIDKTIAIEDVRYHNIRNNTHGSLPQWWHQEVKEIVVAENFLDPVFVVQTETKPIRALEHDYKQLKQGLEQSQNTTEQQKPL